MPNIAILIISSTDSNSITSNYHNNRWITEKLAWKNHYITKPKNIDIFFLECNKDIDKTISIDDTLVNKCSDSSIWPFSPSLYQKTVDSIEYLIKKDKYDYFVRTNLSTFICFDNLNKFIEKYTPTYSGILCNYPSWVNGWGIILNKNIANILVIKGGKHTPIYNLNKPDDVCIGKVLFNNNIKCELDINNKDINIAYLWKFDKSIPYNLAILNKYNSKVFIRLNMHNHFNKNVFLNICNILETIT